jgi:hypothetical protein
MDIIFYPAYIESIYSFTEFPKGSNAAGVASLQKERKTSSQLGPRRTKNTTKMQVLKRGKTAKNTGHKSPEKL